ncbi:uncharacterized protein EAF01_000581 [Botrytis porri]|uniref:uncharacterized protein n=1 Tax=Botrytis porri TaxID=87229 RepID=UPI001901BEF7|nr:uncharacterized protein EAF01_000581 [Botrytis porri]KAF7914175.1 hypothetical protein EAF01_000581 [Botrytis porri]
MGPFCGHGFITTDGVTWQKARALLRPSFSKSNISGLSAYKVAVEQFLRYIPDNGCTTVDLQPLRANLVGFALQMRYQKEEILIKFDLETTLKFLIGMSPNTSSEDERKTATNFIKAFNASMIGTGLSFLIGPFKLLIPKSLTTVAHKQVYDYINAFINKALEKTQKKPTIQEISHLLMQKSLLEGLAKQTDDRIEIRQNIIQGMMAAQGTTYVLISNSLFLLSRNPDLYERLRDEVQYLDLEGSSQLFDLLRDHVFFQNILRECNSSPIPRIPNHEPHCSARYNTPREEAAKTENLQSSHLKVQRSTQTNILSIVTRKSSEARLNLSIQIDGIPQFQTDFVGIYVIWWRTTGLCWSTKSAGRGGVHGGEDGTGVGVGEM